MNKLLSTFIAALFLSSTVVTVQPASVSAKGKILEARADKPYHMIRMAVDDAKRGNTILVHPAFYEESVKVANSENTGSMGWTISAMYPEGAYILGVASYASIPVTNSVTAESAPFKIAQEQVIGGEKDAGGCFIAAGYSWCEAKKACLRPREEYCTAATSKMAVFKCDASKTITATFYPKDDKFVDLVLNDDRKLSVPRAVSASGARYAKADDSFVFWNKGDTAFITENGTETFSNCVTNVQ